MVELSISNTGETLAIKNDKTLLIDADTIAYNVMASTEVENEMFPRSFYSDGHWEQLVSDYGIDENTESYWTVDMEEAHSKFMHRLEDMLNDTGASDWELHFSTGKDTFRHKLTDTYKSNRIAMRYPVGISTLKEELYLAYTDKVEIHKEWEADDAVVAKYDSSKHILCAVDKDVLNSVEGKHWNYYFSGKHGINPKWKEVTADYARKYKYIQTLTGDKIDGIIGLDRVGIKTAEKLILPLEKEEDMWSAVVAKYSEKDRPIDDAILNMRLVNMHQLSFINGKYGLNIFEPIEEVK